MLVPRHCNGLGFGEDAEHAIAQAMLVVHGHFTCNHCADDPTQNTTGGTVIYIVSLPGATQSAFQIGRGAHLHGAPHSTFTVTL